MSPVAKNVLAVVAGIIIGGLVNMAIITIAPKVVPFPEGVDLQDSERLAENIAKLEPLNFVMVWIAHAGGTFVGAVVTALLAASHGRKLAFIIGGFFLLGGTVMVVNYGGPKWFAVADLVGAYIPMAWLGGLFRKPAKSVQGD